MKKRKLKQMLLKEIIKTVRTHYRLNYYGYDTYICRENILEHVLDLCRNDAEYESRMMAIRCLTGDE